jgi:alkylation response protein AidB-like acyl-CoA dehydrogenase
MSAIAFDIEAATAVEGLAADRVTGGPIAPIGDTGARRVLGSPHVVAHARSRGVLLWGSLCHHVKREASRLHPIYARHMVKAMVPERGCQIIDQAIQMHGATGVS